MPEEIFHFMNQRWVSLRSAELSLSLAHDRRRARGAFLCLDARFVPPWVAELEEDQCPTEEHRSMHLSIDGFLPPLESWRDLAGLEWAQVEALVAPDGAVIRHEMRMPDVILWSGGQGLGSLHDHQKRVAEARVLFGAWQDDHRISYTVEAFYRSPRGNREMEKEIQNSVREWMGEPPLHEVNESLLEEGCRLRHEGLAHFHQVSCTVPVNSPDPIAHARHIARRDLGLERFGWCFVNGGKMDGAWEPQHGVGEYGRLVILCTHSLAYEEWKARRAKKETSSPGPQT